eukprot:CAMPEP_0196763790 /NCGR_PEP_ID=MMETSP1095-20130614/4787_1 /TAXON_ID=96789 ORGANISM="Chromulina nebulosa, Strain UTEXLB2642" /NCGR_SAMPLE_ID=MMETSP1095 /ASSEMBLY_ACC=CAM_ASM_000446 /LENGTH=350 /DNA_ID=CAMNT_0042117799 /DNA_START=226 /DNA_END=1278 /DNA_ORIENTATION=+
MTKGLPAWANYIKGTIYQYLNDLPANFSFDAVICSNVPLGSGLSSSASLEVATATFLEKLCSINNVSKVEKALRCQQAEHTFADTPCGIMDQFISALGKDDNLLLIDCRSREYSTCELGINMEDNKTKPIVLVTNSNIKHKLAGSEYPDRVKQCNEAVKVLQSQYPEVKALRDATVDMLDAVKDNLSEVCFKRARHCIGEDKRTLATVKAISIGDYITAGKMMTQSHESLRDDYEVSCNELDILVELALEIPGVYGSRMTGGGFGGCTVTLVHINAVTALTDHLKLKYFERTGIHCECIEAIPSAGADSVDITDLIAKSKKSPYEAIYWAAPLTFVALAFIAYRFVVTKK